MESDRIERTTSFHEKKLGEAVCTFSNDYPNHKKPGYLLLGVKDNGRIADQRIETRNCNSSATCALMEMFFLSHQ